MFWHNRFLLKTSHSSMKCAIDENTMARPLLKFPGKHVLSLSSQLQSIVCVLPRVPERCLFVQADP